MAFCRGASFAPGLSSRNENFVSPVVCDATDGVGRQSPSSDGGCEVTDGGRWPTDTACPEHRQRTLSGGCTVEVQMYRRPAAGAVTGDQSGGRPHPVSWAWGWTSFALISACEEGCVAGVHAHTTPACSIPQPLPLQSTRVSLLHQGSLKWRAMAGVQGIRSGNP